MADVPNITNILAGIETRLDTISGLRVHSEEPDQLNMPAAWPRADGTTIDYDLDMGGSVGIRLVVHLAVRDLAAGSARAHAALLPYLAHSGDYSIKGAIEGDQTLGGTVETLRVARATGIGTYEWGTVQYVGADFEVEIWP